MPSIRILHIVTYMGRGGLETMLMNYYRHIDRSKVQFDFLVHRNFEADYDEEIRSLGGKIYRLPPLNPFSQGYLSQLNAFFSAHSEYCVVHSHLDCMAGIPLKYAKKHGVPVRIAHAHNSSQDKDLKYPLKLFFRCNITKYSTHLFSCSQTAGHWMFHNNEFHVLNNAIHAAAYSYAPDIRECVRLEFGLTADSLVVGHVGRFMRQKNHIFLLQIFSRLPQHAHLLLVGDGELRQSIETQADDLGIRDRIIFTGVRADVNRLLQAMDVFVFPSLFEGLGIAAVEAQAAGLPCLISDKVPIECKKTGLVTQISLDSSVQIWADAVLQAATIPRQDTQDQIRSGGFDIIECAQWLQNFYLEVVKDLGQ